MSMYDPRYLRDQPSIGGQEQLSPEEQQLLMFDSQWYRNWAPSWATMPDKLANRLLRVDYKQVPEDVLAGREETERDRMLAAGPNLQSYADRGMEINNR